MTICQATVLVGEHNEKILCCTGASSRVYVDHPLDRVISVCPQCEVEYLNNDAISIPDTNWPEMLKGVLGGDYGGPSIGFKDNEFILYAWNDDPVCSDIMCQHKNWEVFMVLCAEYSDYIPGEENDHG